MFRLSLLLLAAASRLQAAEGGDVVVRSFGVGAGLPNANVTSACRASDGYLWVGTEGGLARFNGVGFESYRSSNTPGLENDVVQSLIEGADGTLWIGTQSGLYCEKNDRFEPAGLQGVTISALAEDREGRLWIGTAWQGLYCRTQGRLAAIDDPAALPNPRIRDLSVDSLGRVWISLARGHALAYAEQGAVHAFPLPREYAADLTSTCESPGGTFWFATTRHSVLRLQGGHFDSIPFPGRVLALTPDGAGGIWAAGDSLWHSPGGTAFTQTPPYGLTNVVGLRTDREGSLWLCGTTDGLIQVRPSPYRLVPDDPSIQSTGIKMVSEAPDHSLWLATSRQGVVRVRQDGTLQRFGIKDGIIGGDDPSGALAARDGSVYVGSAGILWHLRDGRVAPVPGVGGIHGMFEDRAGGIWIGSDSGVVHCAPGASFVPVPLPGGHPQQGIIATAFGEGADGSIYVATWLDGVYRLRGGAVERMGRATGLPNSEVRSLLVDRDGLVWVGLRTAGLAVWVDGKWCHSDALSQAVGDHVAAIAEDDHGHLWLGTTLGILWGAKSDMLAAARGLGPAPKVRLAGPANGPESPSIWLGGQPNVWKTDAGALLFATHRGAMEIDPARLPENLVPPPVRITRVVVDDHPFVPAGVLDLPPGPGRIAFDYDALSFVQSDRIRFQYRLEGYSPEWTDAGTQRSVSFGRLPPQAYVFRVRAENADGVWNEAGAALRFRIEPYLWQRWWVRLAAMLAFTGLVAGIARYVSFRRLRSRLAALEQEAALNRERARIAKDIHDDLGGSLTQLKLLLERVERDRSTPDKIGAHVRQGLTAARAAIKSLDETVWAVNPRNDTLPHLIDYLGQFAMEYLTTAGIGCRLELPDHPPEVPVPADVRHHYFLVVKEALHNVVRHGAATEVQLHLDITPEGVRTRIEDNGCGFERAPDNALADGLRNMRQRMEEAGGSFTIHSEPNAGTRVSLLLPLT